MFGYVRVAPPALDTPSYRQYQGIYCSLCKQLGRRYGLWARFILNYDLTFLALFRLASRQQDPHFSAGHCSFSPFCKRLCCDESESLAEAADLSVLLTYYKLKDNAADERGVKRLVCRCLLRLLRGAYRKATVAQPAAQEQIAAYMQRQAELEAAETVSIDAAADPFACFLATLLAPAEPDSALYRFGYCLGRWVYLADAVDDLPSDARSGSYNPYLSAARKQGESPNVKQLQEAGIRHLNVCQAVCKEAYEALPLRRFDPVFRNVLYVGMPTVQQDLLLTKRERRKAARRWRKKREL